MIGRVGVAIGAGAVVLTVGILRWMGRQWWCTCGSWLPFSWNVWSEHNSQHLVDPYTFSHVQHGFLFALVLWPILRRRSPELRFSTAVVVEAAWEVLENTNAVIDRYRETTVSLDYHGDSILNSVADIGACMLGYLVAQRVPWWVTVGMYVAIEIGMVLTIRDSLLLNILMLVAPFDAIRTWQAGAAG